MGKKRVIQKTQEEILKETEKRENVERKASQSLVSKGKKKKLSQLNRANIYIRSTYNNTIVTLATLQGDVVAWASAGALGFKGPKKATPFAATKVIETLIGKVKNLQVREVNVFVRGIGSGRDSAIKALANYGLEINGIKDVTPVPHNGCRARKARRV